mmetsp:Transcript_19592/g.31251  ORF Transcript_19592/g.31251 Transcript_19592/m.31251 type:complete len:97 (-) Transcript_19592:162-452(-)
MSVAVPPPPLIIGVEFFFDYTRGAETADFTFNSPSLIVESVHTASKLHELCSKVLVSLTPAHIVLDIPQLSIDGDEFVEECAIEPLSAHCPLYRGG